MPPVKLFLSVRDRAQCTRECLDGLIRSTAGQADIFVFDNHSGSEFDELFDFYRQLLDDGKIAHLACNRFTGSLEMYWSKNYAWAQFLALVSILPPEQRQYLAMVDNDVNVRRNDWLRASIAVLESESAQRHNVAVVSPHDGPPDPSSNPDMFHNLAVDKFGGRTCEIRDAVCSRVWVASWNFWIQWEPPAWKQVERNGKPDRMPTDWYYWTRMQRTGRRFAVLRPRLIADPPHPWPSARMGNAIGEDA